MHLCTLTPEPCPLSAAELGEQLGSRAPSLHMPNLASAVTGKHPKNSIAERNFRHWWAAIPHKSHNNTIADRTTAPTMSYPTRSIPSHIRQPSMAPHTASTSQSPALVARVNEKKAELENLKELRDLSAAVASQMEALEQKLATLSDGTEGTALAQANTESTITGREN